MERYYGIIRKITYPATYLRKAVEFLLCMILNIEPHGDVEELPFDETVGHTPHGEFLFPLKAAAFNIIVFVIQLAGAIGFYGAAIVALNFLKVGPIDAATGMIDLRFFMYIIFMYLGISFISNLFPSQMSVENFWGLCITGGGFISKIIFIIPCIILRFGAFLEKFGITAILSVVLPIVLAFVI